MTKRQLKNRYNWYKVCKQQQQQQQKKQRGQQGNNNPFSSDEDTGINSSHEEFYGGLLEINRGIASAKNWYDYIKGLVIDHKNVVCNNYKNYCFCWILNTVCVCL